MKILFLIPYPLNESPSQRFRFEQYFAVLKERGYRFDVQCFLNHTFWRVIFKKGNVLSKLAAIIAGFTKRIFALFVVHRYDVIFIHREVTPVGPPVFEWLFARVWKKRIIYDFDDAIWLTDRKNEPFYLKLLKWRSKVKTICGLSYRVSCGNEYLCAFARKYKNDVILNPTTIDTEKLHNPQLFKRTRNSEDVNVGWTGSHSTLKYLESLESTLQILEAKFPTISITVIADRAPNLALKSLVFKKWSHATEVAELFNFDIGIMPLPDTEWAKGKCGFKALQYMAMQIPTVASPVGVNKTIIKDSVNGLLANNAAEWIRALTLLIENKDLRIQMGIEGRNTVVSQYSVSSNTEVFLSLFR